MSRFIYMVIATIVLSACLFVFCILMMAFACQEDPGEFAVEELKRFWTDATDDERQT